MFENQPVTQSSWHEEANMAAVQNVPFTLGIYALKRNFVDFNDHHRGLYKVCNISRPVSEPLGVVWYLSLVFSFGLQS